MKLGANTVLFGGHDLQTAFRCLALAGYDGVEVSAISGMSQHLVLDRWREIVPELKSLSASHGLQLLAMEQPSQDPDTMEAAFSAAVESGIPVINCGPGGKTGDEDSFKRAIDSLQKLARRAEHHGVTLCVKAHVGAAIHDSRDLVREDAGPPHLAAKQAANGQGLIPNDLGLQAQTRLPRQQPIPRISLGQVRPVCGGLAVGAGRDNQPLDRFYAPTLIHELTGQPVQQLRMRGGRAAHAKVVFRFHQAQAKIPLPNPIDSDPGG